jgi:hypothetical protein
MSEYVEGVYNAFKIGRLADKIYDEINHQTKFMGVG